MDPSTGKPGIKPKPTCFEYFSTTTDPVPSKHTGFCSSDWSHRPESQALSQSNCWKASKGHDNSVGGEKFPSEVFPLRTSERPSSFLGG
ncbi:hypothetical protein CEXT_240691 [Caerostris extrusa]|uniref:Uncharacterized protein n=1 Tax=Caerostris extrusa TaxID=172846 RepID=A0AAV4PBZ8_CAEEX|nr:hypothetical protein CEXT_240691 [Caerostris extrusa]